MTPIMWMQLFHVVYCSAVASTAQMESTAQSEWFLEMFSHTKSASQSQCNHATCHLCVAGSGCAWDTESSSCLLAEAAKSSTSVTIRDACETPVPAKLREPSSGEPQPNRGAELLETSMQPLPSNMGVPAMPRYEEHLGKSSFSDPPNVALHGSLVDSLHGIADRVGKVLPGELEATMKQKQAKGNELKRLNSDIDEAKVHLKRFKEENQKIQDSTVASFLQFSNDFADRDEWRRARESYDKWKIHVAAMAEHTDKVRQMENLRTDVKKEIRDLDSKTNQLFRESEKRVAEMVHEAEQAKSKMNVLRTVSSVLPTATMKNRPPTGANSEPLDSDAADPSAFLQTSGESDDWQEELAHSRHWKEEHEFEEFKKNALLADFK